MKHILFVCVQNSCRSQLAEAFCHIYKSGSVNVYSAGLAPSGEVNRKALTSMAELGYDMGAHRSKPLSDVPSIPYDAVITIDCDGQCPGKEGRVREDWVLPDPDSLNDDQFRWTRDQIEKRVIDLLRRLN